MKIVVLLLVSALLPVQELQTTYLQRGTFLFVSLNKNSTDEQYNSIIKDVRLKYNVALHIRAVRNKSGVADTLFTGYDISKSDLIAAVKFQSNTRITNVSIGESPTTPLKINTSKSNH